MANDMKENLQELISVKAIELFDICDKEKKGFIIKRDIQRLRDELGVEPEQLEDVFDSLDIDHNGFLTLDEFTVGFGHFLASQMTHTNDLVPQSFENESKEQVQQEEFHQTLEALGAKNVYDDEEIIMGLWMKLRETDPILLRQFEEFLSKTTDEIKRSKVEHRHFEAALQTKSSLYEDEIKKLYDEMEQQIQIEKEAIVEHEKVKERETREQMEEELHRKEQQLSEIMRKQTEFELRFLQSNSNETEVRNENERLQKEKILLEEQLQEISKNLQESKSYISQLQMQTKKEKRDRAKQTLNLTENLAIEHENLVKELNLLKIMNTQLLDERDLHQGVHKQGNSVSPTRRHFRTQGSVLSDYIISPHRNNSEPEEEDENDAERNRDSNHHSGTEHLGTRQQPVGANAIVPHFESVNNLSTVIPDRLFKVAFIGDSGVGKTTFIQRLCNGTFKESFAATIGVDLQVKMLNIDNRTVGLQLWDTAGQERFRSITQQYFRKSDGIILVYDVTSESTFRNVRAWMSSVRELVEEDCVIVLLGNKTDLCNDDERRPVKYKDGARLADEYGCLFFECSTRSGTSILEPMEAIARLMQEKDDRLRQGENVINLSSKKKKKRFCC